MCGIAGVIGLPGTKACLGSLPALLSPLGHRGTLRPSSRSYANAALGCVRLPIVDSQGGTQPMETARLAVVFNGEIYNHAALREELEAKGVRFVSRSDTEVLLHGFAQWGEALLDRLEGMYAFVLIDRVSGDFLAARDPFGIKPLYYVSTDEAWYFCSEIHPLLALGLGEVALTPPGGHVLNGVVSGRQRYEEISPAPMGMADAVRQFKAELAASVESHLPPDDLPVAVFCSGGIDSSAILFEAVEACKRRGWDPKTKLVTSVGTASGEDPQFAARLTEELDVPFVFEQISIDSMIEYIPFAVRVMESFEPNHIRAGTTSLALARRVAQDGFRVALLGEGADELLGGYEEFPDAARRGAMGEVEDLLRVFSRQLHRTQLRRVDRTSMAFALEARVPFLSRRLTRLINRIPTECKVYRRDDGEVIGKYVLREAYRGLLPDYIVDRRKVPMGEGAGVGDNRPAGPFHAHSETAVCEEMFAHLVGTYPQFKLQTKEEALYFSLFLERFGALPLAADRPRTNALKTT